MNRSAFVCIVLLLLAGSATAQQRTVKGRVLDNSTGEGLQGAHVVTLDSLVGGVTDRGGYFSISIADSVRSLEFSMIGYETKTQRVGRGGDLRVRLRPSANNLHTVMVSAGRSRKRYSRHENPALDLARQVIAHKDSNSMAAFEYYACHRYAKTNLAFDEFHPNFERNWLWKHFPFAEDYIDRTPFDNTEILNFSINENFRDEYHRSPASLSRTLITATRSDGLGAVMDEEGMNEGPEGLFQPVDIYQNEMELLNNRFISPLSSTLANATYHFFITDTVVMDGVQCVELTFKPVNKSDYAFDGRMYVAVGDSSYAVVQYEMRVARYANINFVHNVHLQQTFVRDSLGHYLPERNDIYGRLALTSRVRLFRKLYIHQVNVCTDYSFVDTVQHFPDSLFGPATTLATLPTARKVRCAEINEMRPIALSEPELLIDSFRYELMRVPWARRTLRTFRVLGTGYIPTMESFDSSRFDIGPIYNFYSENAFEGARFRVGGMTKASLNPRNFADGYLAYGTMDNHFKFGINLTHTKDPHRKHAHEHPFNAITLSLSHDVESPGVAFGLFDHDNVLMTSTSRMIEYVSNAEFRFQRQWGGSLNVDSRLSAQQHQPVGDLTYSRRMEDGSWQPVGRYNTIEWKSSLSFVPNQKVNDVRNTGALTNPHRNPFSITATHAMGWFENYYYNMTTLKMRKLLWLAPLGYMDLHAEAGKQWNQVPLPKLFFPLGTSSEYLITGAFNALTPMEFVADQYVAFYANYHLRGLIFNHLPIIRRFGLREVASFNFYWGSLSQRNDPDNLQPGLYRLPDQTGRLSSSLPYMEWSVGVENILNIIRIDYVSRLSYVTEQPTFANCLRIGLEISL